MNFHHSEERQALQDSLRQMLGREYDMAARAATIASHSGLSENHWKLFTEIGVFHVLLPQSVGGLGGSGLDIMAVFEAVGPALVVEPLRSVGVLAASALSLGGGHQELIDGLLEGRNLVSWAHAETAAGYSPAYVETTATPTSQGWLLTGGKVDVDHGAAATHLIISARTAGAVDDPAGLALFVLPSDTPGVGIQEFPTVDGRRTAHVALDNVLVPAAAAVGPVGEAYPLIEAALSRGIVAVCAEALGMMQAAFESTREYLLQRHQFGVALSSFQALQHRMVDLWVEIQQAESAVINAAYALDSTSRAHRERTVSAAKFTLGRAALHTAEEAIQLHGAIGMTDELTLSHLAKALVAVDHILGDEDHHLQRYITLSKEIAA